MTVTASQLYNYLQCPHRVWRDENGPEEEKIKDVNPFVKMLWERGVAYEKEVVDSVGAYLDVSKGGIGERYKKTVDAMKNEFPLIYQGILQKDNLFGIPDMLRLEEDGSYVPIDIKSGMAYKTSKEKDKERMLKEHYAVQLALYSDILQRLGFESERKGIVLDIKGNKVVYDLNEQIGERTPTTFWQFYKDVSLKTEELSSGAKENKPAISSICKLCPWYNSCKKWVEENDDLSGIFFVGTNTRNTLKEDLHVSSVKDVLSIDIKEALEKKKGDKTFLKRIGEKKLRDILKRAYVLRERGEPVVYERIEFPNTQYELFFDIEADPTREFVYMHGVYERGPNEERYIDFTAKENSDEAEKEAWQNFWEYIRSLPEDGYTVYYYSKYERTTYRALRKKYPDVVSEKELKEFFNPSVAIDLYNDVIMKKTDWPLGSYSIKDIAVYLGFEWEDESPSGALSIEWFDKYLETGDEKILERILVYNKDDCKATMVVKDGLQNLSDKKYE